MPGYGSFGGRGVAFVYKRTAERSSGWVHIALVTETFPPEINGVAMTYGVLVRELVRLGHVVTVCRPAVSQSLREPDVAGRRQEFLPGVPIPGYPELRMGLPAGGRLKRLWEKARPDVVHVATEGPLGASAVSTALELGIPVTSGFHTNFHAYARHYGFGLMRGWVLAWLRRLHNRTALTFAPTAELMGQLGREGFRNLALLSRGVDTEQFNPARRCEALRSGWGAGPRDCVVLHVGRLAPEKNYPLLADIYAKMRAANSSCRFVFVGEGPLRERLSRELPGCFFEGAVPHGGIGRYYASADVYIHASQSETFGNVVLEGLASGLAFAGFDYAAAAEIVRHRENGLLAECGSGAALTEAAVELAQDETLRRRLREAAVNTVTARSWAVVAGRFASDLRQVVSGGGLRPLA